MKITKKLIDRALELQALIAPLAAEFDAIKEAVKAEGDGIYAGRLAEIEVTTTETCTLDTKNVRDDVLNCARAPPASRCRIAARRLAVGSAPAAPAWWPSARRR